MSTEQTASEHSRSETSDQERAGKVTGPIVRGLAGPCIALATYILLGYAEGLPAAARSTAAIGILMAVLWMTEALPLAVTALIPLILFPLTNTLTFSAAAQPYASKFIFLFMGGFILAAGIEKWGLHRRIALGTLAAVGTEPLRLIGGFMLVTAGLSMWISNTATAMLMLPIANSTISLIESSNQTPSAEEKKQLQCFINCLLLGIAYASSIGGIGTLIGTPPNAFLAGFLEVQKMSIGFGQWMVFALPFVVVALFIAWLVLGKWVYPVAQIKLSGGKQMIATAIAQLGPISRGERIVATVFSLTALAWILRAPIGKSETILSVLPAVGRINDSMIAVAGAFLLFVIPVNLRKGEFALDWNSASRIPWNILLLFGGGLSLAKAINDSQLSRIIGGLFANLQGLPALPLLVLVVVAIIGLTELSSNTATAAAFLPVLHGVALGMQLDPMRLLVPAALAASCAFLLPVGTPPNAIIFGSGRLAIRDMIRAGIRLHGTVSIGIPFYVQYIGSRLLKLTAK